MLFICGFFDFRRPVMFVGRKNELKLPRGYAVEKALISLYGPDNSLKDTGYFHHFVTLDDILRPI